MAILMPANKFVDGRYFQLTLGRKLSSQEHFHKFYEIICVIDGECTQIVNGKSLFLSCGSIYILRPDDCHYFTTQAKNTSVAALSVSPEIFENFAQQYLIEVGDNNLLLKFSFDELKLFTELCNKLNYTDREIQAPLFQVLLGMIFSVIILRRDHSLPKINLPQTVYIALEELKNIEVAAEGVAAMIRISKFSHTQLCRITKKCFGKTPIEMITEARMKHAYRLVVNSDTNLLDIGQTLGYDSYSQFYNVFSKYYNKSPSYIRKKFRITQTV